MNTAAKVLMKARAVQNKEASERDTCARDVLKWTQTWRPLVLATGPVAPKAVRDIPADAPTPDDLADAADDIASLVSAAKAQNGTALSFAKVRSRPGRQVDSIGHGGSRWQ